MRGNLFPKQQIDHTRAADTGFSQQHAVVILNDFADVSSVASGNPQQQQR